MHARGGGGGATGGRLEEWWRVLAQRSWSGDELGWRSLRRWWPQGKVGAVGPRSGTRWTALPRWEVRRGEHEREAFGVELADDIGEQDSGARGRGNHGAVGTRGPCATVKNSGTDDGHGLDMRCVV
jgi:hypothetical protein